MDKHEGWGAGVIPRLARELKNEMPELKGFSERNIKRMLAFFLAYPDLESIVTQPAAQLHLVPTLQQPAAKTSDSAKEPQLVAKLGDERSRLLVEYSFAGIDKPIGISTAEAVA